MLIEQFLLLLGHPELSVQLYTTLSQVDATMGVQVILPYCKIFITLFLQNLYQEQLENFMPAGVSNFVIEITNFVCKYIHIKNYLEFLRICEHQRRVETEQRNSRCQFNLKTDYNSVRSNLKQFFNILKKFNLCLLSSNLIRNH